MIVFSPIAALTGEHALQVAVTIAFGLDTLWIFLLGMWLTLAGDIPLAVFVRRGAFLLLVVAAGLVGIGLVAAPGATGKFFAWGLGPEPLAAFAGGVYIGSAALYAVAIPRPWREVRGLVAGAVLLSVSVLVVTLTHLDQFDFDRLQAWAWIVLFAGFSLVTLWLLLAGGEPDDATASAEPLPAWTRATLALVAAILGLLAVALWIDPSGLADASPYNLPPLGGRFAGSWIALLVRAHRVGRAAQHQGGGVAARARPGDPARRRADRGAADGRRPRARRRLHRGARRPDRDRLVRYASDPRIRSTASVRRSSGTVSEILKKPSPLGP